MNEYYQLVSESLFFDSDDLTYNLEQWKRGKSNILLITGFCGSGKTTMGQQLAKKYNAKFVSLDRYYKTPGEHRKLKNLKDSKSIKKYLDNQKTRKVYESTSILMILDPEDAEQFSIILRGISYLTSSIRATKRDTEEEGYERAPIKDRIKTLWYFLSINKYYMSRFRKWWKYLKEKK